MHLKANIGSLDRIVRFVLGLLLLVIAWFTQSGFMLLGGLFSIFEALVSWCVLYQLLGINTCPIKQRTSKPIPLLKLFFRGSIIFIIAVAINALATLVGWSTWHTFLQSPQTPLTLDNYIFLFLMYPVSFGVGSMIATTLVPDTT